MKDRIRMLYVSYTLLGDECATGQTLQNIFNACNKVDVMQYCLDYSSDYHNCNRDTVFFSAKKSPLFYSLKSIYRKRDKGKPNRGAAVETNRIGGNPIVIIARAILDVLPKRLDRGELGRIDSFKPNIVYTTGENITTLIHAISLSKRYNIPIVIHLMDNTEDSVYAGKIYTSLFRKIYLQKLKIAYRRSKCNLAISPKMAFEFERRHGTEFGFAMNCIHELHKGNETNNSPLRFVFSGGLHGGRAQILKRMGELIQNDPFLNSSVRLEVYTSKANVDYYKKILGSVLYLNEYVPQELMFENLGNADVLVHCESFDKDEIEFFRYSMSTKIPEYLSVGKPILCYGPEEICTVSYLAENEVGYVVSNEKNLKTALVSLVKNEKKRNEFGSNAFKLANEHLAPTVANRVETILMKAISEWSTIA